MFKNLISFFTIFIICLFYFNVFNYYSSNQNIKDINLNRDNIKQILKTKAKNLPVLSNNTNDVIDFNSGFDNEIRNSEPRKFWNLLK